MNKRQLGLKGETQGTKFLKKQGYRIIERNFRTRSGEIDIIAREGREIVFIEVKTRSSLDFGYPEESVTRRKMAHLLKASQYYMLKSKIEMPYRFEVLSVIADKEKGYRFEIIPIE